MSSLSSLLIILGTAGIIASLFIAHSKGIIKKQLIFFSALAVAWWIMFVIKASLATSGFSQDQIGLPRSVFIELMVGYIYPYTIAPLAAIIFVVLNKRRSIIKK